MSEVSGMGNIERGKASLNVEIWNGPSQVVGGYGLTTEQAVEEVCGYLPAVPVSQLQGAVDLLRRLANSGVTERLSKVELHIEREAWDALAPYRDGGQ